MTLPSARRAGALARLDRHRHADAEVCKECRETAGGEPERGGEGEAVLFVEDEASVRQAYGRWRPSGCASWATGW